MGGIERARAARESGYPAMRTSLEHPVAGQVLRAVAAWSDREPVVIPILGGSVPAVWFPVVTGTDVVILPTVNPDNNQHSPNENLRLGHFFEGIATLASVLRMR